LTPKPQPLCEFKEGEKGGGKEWKSLSTANKMWMYITRGGGGKREGVRMRGCENASMRLLYTLP
jgi:hypothetical protein